jgi:hypothetical protein
MDQSSNCFSVEDVMFDLLMKSRDSPVASHSTVSGADTSTTTRKKFERRVEASN